MASNMWFFDVLGIEPTNDKTAIKQAYSRIAHKTNPEDDPDGYAKLHEAYRTALEYAAGNQVEQTEYVPQKADNSGFDFSTVNEKERLLDLDATELGNTIRNFKSAVGIYSYEMVFKRPKNDIFKVLSVLFKLYSELADRTNVESAMINFLAEPLIIYCMDDDVLRDFLKNKLPKEDPCSARVTEHIEEYEKELELRKIRQKIDETESKIYFVKKLRWGISAAAAAALGVLSMLLTEHMGLALFSVGIQVLLLCIGIAGFCAVKYYMISASMGNGKAQDRKFTISMFIMLLIAVNVISLMCFFEGAYETQVNYYICLAICIIFTVADIVAIVKCFIPVLMGKKQY